MSLKTFHVVFILASTLLSFLFSGWGFRNYFVLEESAVNLAYGIIASMVGLGLIVYGIYFLKKLKHISYL